MENRTETQLHRPLILVAEDNESNFLLIQAIIGKKCDILWARTGDEAVDLFTQNQPRVDGILMDIKMPGTNGLEATCAIRSLSAGVPIVVQTAHAFSSDRENALNVGATDVLVKPITLSILRDCLSKYFPGIQW